MRYIIVMALAVGVLVVLTEPAPLAQDAPQQPTFRTGVDLIQLDVTVLDQNRRPVQGLTAADFAVLENGKPQRIVAVSAIDAVTSRPEPSPRMRLVQRDVMSNDLVDDLDGGGAVAIVIDDSTLPFDSVDIAVSTRDIARHVLDQLGPLDQAAVVYTLNAGRSQDFTSDPRKLNQAVDAFDPHPPVYDPARLGLAGAPGALSNWVRFGRAGGSECFRQKPAVPALDALVTRLANIPQRRKALFFISTFGPSDLKTQMGCPGVITEIMKGIFAKAARGNVNIYPIDPSGRTGYEDYLRMQGARGGRRAMPTGAPNSALGESGSQGASGMPSSGGGGGIRPPGTDQRPRRETLQIMADYTGGRAVLSTDAIAPAIDRIFEEDSSYYLIGYQTANTKPDGAFRRLEVKVNRPKMTVLYKSGYWATRKGDVVMSHEEDAIPTDIATTAFARSGISQPSGLRLRATAVPTGRAEGGATRAVEITAVLTVHLPPLTQAANETVSVVRTVHDIEGKGGPPVEQRVTLPLAPPENGEVTYDIVSHFSAPPGRYEVRFHAHSTLADENGNVWAEIDVPDLARSPLTLSNIVLGTSASAPVRGEIAAAQFPFVPTTRREFAQSEQVRALVRVFQGGSGPPSPLTVRTELIDAADRTAFDRSVTLAAGSFDARGAADHVLDLPLEGLAPGHYLLSVTAATAGGTTRRQDVVIRLR